MIEIPLIDELREVRRRLSEAQVEDVTRYAEMLRQVGTELPGQYVRQPLRPDSAALAAQSPKK